MLWKWMLLALSLILIGSLAGCEFVRNLVGTSENVRESSENVKETTRVVREFMVESLIPAGLLAIGMWDQNRRRRKWRRQANGADQVVIPEDPDGTTSS